MVAKYFLRIKLYWGGGSGHYPSNGLGRGDMLAWAFTDVFDQSGKGDLGLRVS